MRYGLYSTGSRRVPTNYVFLAVNSVLMFSC